MVGIEIDSDGLGRGSLETLPPEEQEEMRQLAGRPDVYDIVAKSIAPSIYGGLGIYKFFIVFVYD